MNALHLCYTKTTTAKHGEFSFNSPLQQMKLDGSLQDSGKLDSPRIPAFARRVVVKPNLDGAFGNK
jgi:hypothetical protein